MFKRITIHMAGPICTCETQDLSWGTTANSNSLEIWCKMCKTRLVVPREKFVAAFDLEVSYPAETRIKQETPVLQLFRTDPKPGKPS